MTEQPPGPTSLDERFAAGLDEQTWTPAYMPAWSSRAAAAATWSVQADGLHLSLPPEHPRWCPDLHPGALRVSAVQSGNWSGPLGSTRGQQPFADGLVVTEEQPAQWGCTPWYGRVEVECRAVLDPASMFSAWMVGLEDRPERCGEICLVEVFGDTVAGGSVGLGSGLHPFRDPALHEEFSAEPTALDVAGWHRYAVTWTPDGVTFSVDGRTHRTSAQSPAYPMELVLAVFDFPDRRTAPATLVTELDVRQVQVRPPG
ncbi:Glycosyl hydrolases family 16 [Friedmanniella luteola]|uniref:Glycosyl hydrolases family 16 n=1 Tax=Friedmanniella luteola TaxID=546871 RepID=A0A1H1M0W3_9ACTN|nr:glycoside hydrolase family 16 protein [Friedmanniella luteola]SDR80464.1 Glycosyl hydrolases family 16 [Friedmanniella luteola]